MKDNTLEINLPLTFQMEDLTNYGENVAAITANIHQDKETYQEIYETLADDVWGFVWIRSLCAESAKAFTIEESPYTAWEDFYWIEAIEEFSHLIIGCLKSGEVPEVEKMHRFAAGSIEKCLIAEINK